MHISQENWIFKHNRRGRGRDRDRDRDQGHLEAKASPEQVEIEMEDKTCKPPREVWGKCPR